MRAWEVCVNAAPTAEKSGMARIFSVDVGYLETIGGRCRIVVCGWSFEVYGPMRSDTLR